MTGPHLQNLFIRGQLKDWSMGLQPRAVLLGLLLLLGHGKSARVRPAGGPCCWAMELGRGTSPLREHKTHSSGPSRLEYCGPLPEAVGPEEGHGMGEDGQAAAPSWGTKAVSVGSHRDLDSGSPCCVAWANAPSLDLDFFPHP